MNNSIVMDVILSLSLVFIYYIYTKIDKEIDKFPDKIYCIWFHFI